MNRWVVLSNKGQVTLFVILALVIVAVVISIFTFPEVNVFSSTVNPSSYLRSCIETEVENVKNVLSDQGGYQNPTNYAMYQDLRLQYLCYTSEFYTPCIVQQPLLLKYIQDEMKAHIEPRAKQCLDDLKEQYERRGYEVRSGSSNITINVIPGSIIVEFIAPLTITKDDTQTFQKFAVSINSEWHRLINTAVNIIQYESAFGDSETSLYISSDADLKIQKTRRDDGSTIYQLSDVTTEDRFSFATRSLVWPQGFE